MWQLIKSRFEFELWKTDRKIEILPENVRIRSTTRRVSSENPLMKIFHSWWLFFSGEPFSRNICKTVAASLLASRTVYYNLPLGTGRGRWRYGQGFRELRRGSLVVYGWTMKKGTERSQVTHTLIEWPNLIPPSSAKLRPGRDAAHARSLPGSFGRGDFSKEGVMSGNYVAIFELWGACYGLLREYLKDRFWVLRGLLRARSAACYQMSIMGRWQMRTTTWAVDGGRSVSSACRRVIAYGQAVSADEVLQHLMTGELGQVFRETSCNLR